MLRSFAVVVSALAAFAAQAQEGKSAESDAAKSASAAEKIDRPVLVASRTNPPATTDARVPAPASGGNPAAKPPGMPVEPADCSAIESFLDGTKLIVRAYQAPPTASANGWMRAPFVAAVARCGRLYILQVRSESRDPWVVRQARLATPGGVVLQVQALHSSERKDQRAVNVIVAKAPQGAKLPTLKLDLSGEDGRVAQAEVGDLP
jgi:hypothetical protein